MKKNISIFSILLSGFLYSQVGINTETPHSSSDLELGSSNKALYLNRVQNPEIQISSPQNGMILYDTTKKCVRAYQADTWSNCFGITAEEPPALVSLGCTSAIHLGGSIVSGQNYTGSSRTTSIPYTGGNGGSYTVINVNSTGVTGLVARLVAGNLNNGDGSLVFNITGTPSGAGTANFEITIGGKTCTFSRNVEPPIATVVSLVCGSPTHVGGSIVSGQNYTGSSRTTSIPYTGGNGGSYTVINVNSTGVTGLIARLVAGNLNNGDGSLVFNITGTPSGAGTANFEITIGGKTCTFSRNVDTPVALGCTNDSYITHSGQSAVRICGQIWMRHNLGANVSLNPDADPQSQGLVGNYYQWGRKAVVANGATNAGAISGYNSNWTDSISKLAWNSGTESAPVKNTTNDPCPTGYRVPTQTELDKLLSIMTAEFHGADWTENSANFENALVLKNSNVQITFPANGYRGNFGDGRLASRASSGSYYSSTTVGDIFYVKAMTFWKLPQSGASTSGFDAGNRARNLKCIAQ